ncbi:MAG: ABC transporter substrate-binding protein [Deltaproteobacteria bacterium]|nr:ABC transporter substrate-binding protein [Deltaproteobacteria bacterium]
MKKVGKGFLLVGCLFFLLSLVAFGSSKALAANAKFEVGKMGDMSDFDPNNPAVTGGDTIKIAMVASFSGPAAFVGQMFYLSAIWVAHDINKRGGLMVDGKKKLVQVIKADHMSKPDQTKKICERMVLQEKVHVLLGTNGSHLMKIINETANRYKVIAQNFTAVTDDLMDAQNFSRYAFMSTYSTEQIGRAFAYYYGQVRKKEKKFYILCQDYMFGHSMAAGFKHGLKEYYPGAEIVGEDYHKLFLTDFAPYLTKIKASGAEVIYTGDWIPDAANLVKQARQMGIKQPFAHLFLDEANFLADVGVEGSKGLTVLNAFETEGPWLKTPDQIKFYKIWNELWKNKWKAPYNTPIFEYPIGAVGYWASQYYWLLSVIERAGSTDPEKIIKVWENDSFQDITGKVYKMRACDHKAISDLLIIEFVPPEQQKVSFNIAPYYWYKNFSYYGPSTRIPAEKALPFMDKELDRCKGKSPAGQ